MLAVAVAACAGHRPAPSPEGGDADFARVYLAKGGETFVEDPARGLTWLGIVSHELPFDQAATYCQQLPPRPTGAWRLPGVDELAAAPFGRYQLPDPPVRLWSASGPPGDTALRWVVDPYTRAREVREVRGSVHLRVLCVTGGTPAGP
jgi:hypothetical protein